MFANLSHRSFISNKRFSYDLNIISDTSNYNIFEALGRPINAVHVSIVVYPGVVVSSASSTIPALSSGSLPIGSTISLINRGSILGAGGAGGNFDVNVNGQDGGDAIFSSVPLLIDNTDGYIFGGGGGGQTVGMYNSGWYFFSAGGGGQGMVGGYAGTSYAYPSSYYAISSNAVPGTASAPGIGAVTTLTNYGNVSSYGGGGGGTWGQPGGGWWYSSTLGWASQANYAYAVGAGGFAIRTQGLITIIGGNTVDKIKGNVS